MPNDDPGIVLTPQVAGESYSGAPDGLETPWDRITRAARLKGEATAKAVTPTGILCVQHNGGVPLRQDDTPYGLDTREIEDGDSMTATPRTKRPETLPPLNADVTWVLCVLAEGGRIEARRTYPHRHNFWVIKADGHKYARCASELGVATLIERGLIYAITHDHPKCDEIDYRATTQGREAVAARNDLPHEDPGQSDLFDGAP